MANTIVLALNGLLGALPPVDALVHDMTPYLATLASWSSLLGVILALLVGLILLFLNRRGHAYRWLVSGRALTTSFIVVLLAGFVVYDVGMYISHEPLSLLTNVPMAIIHAFEMFLLHSDLTELRTSVESLSDLTAEPAAFRAYCITTRSMGW